MPRPGQIKILLAPPNYHALDAVLTRFFAARNAKLICATAGTRRTIQGRIFANKKFLQQFDDEQSEILLFSDLLHQLCGLLQLPFRQICSPDQAAAVAGIALRKLGEDTPFHAVRRLPGFHGAVVDLLGELQRNRIPFSELMDLGTKPEAVSLALASVLDRFEEYRVSTGSRRIEQIISRQDCNLSEFRKLIWVGETDWNPITIALLKWLSDRGVSIELLAEQHPSNEGFYKDSTRLRSELPDAEIETLACPFPLAAHLYGLNPDGPVEVETFCGEDKFIEVDWIVRDILTKLRNGAKPDSLAIYTRNAERYGPMLIASGGRLGVRFACKWQELIRTNPFAQLVVRAVSALLDATPFKLLALLNDPYFGLKSAGADAARTMIQAALAEDDSWLAVANSAELPEPVRMLASARNAAVVGDRTLADWLRWINSLVAAMPWLDCSAKAGKEISERDASASHFLIRAIELSKISISTSQRFRYQEFVDLIVETVENTDYFVRKQGDVQVYSHSSEIGNVQHLYIIGMTEGSFPPRRAEEPILLDKHRVQIANRLPETNLPTSYDRMEEHRREFHRLLCKSNKVTVSWPNSSDGHPEVRSAYILELTSQLNGVKETTRSLGERFPVPDEAKAWHDRLASYLLAQAQIPDDLKSICSEIRDASVSSQSEQIEESQLQSRLALIPNPVRMSDLRALRKCRFQYLCRSHFRLLPRRTVAIQDQILDIIRSADLVHAKTREQIQSALEASLEKCIAKLRRTTTREELALLRFIAPNLLRAFADREVAARELWELTPAAQRIKLSEPHFTPWFRTSRQKLDLDLTLDMLYFRGPANDPVPMQIGWVSKDDSESEEFQMEAGLLAIRTNGTQARAAIVDSPENSIRRMIAGKADLRAKGLTSGKGNLVARPVLPLDKLKSDIGFQIRHLELLATTSEFKATKGRHCSRCGFASLCRRAEGARFFEQGLEE